MKEEIIGPILIVLLFVGVIVYFVRFSDRSLLEKPMIQKSGLVIENEIIGNGAEAAKGKKLWVHYVGTLRDGTQFDSSRKRGEVPYDFILGVGQVIPGWDEGLLGMKVGGKRKLTIPPTLAYGGRTVGVIPPNSTLIFEVELIKIDEK